MGESFQAVGHGHVDWTDGERPVNKLERLIAAFASGDRYERLETARLVKGPSADFVVRQEAVDRYVHDMTAGWGKVVEHSSIWMCGNQSSPSSRCVVVTGATGSSRCHLVAKFASLPDVTQIICLGAVNRIFGPIKLSLFSRNE